MSVGSALGVAFLATGSTAAFAAEDEYTDLSFSVEIEGQELNINISLKNEFHAYPGFVRVRYLVKEGETYGFYSLQNEDSFDYLYWDRWDRVDSGFEDPVSMGSDIGNLEIAFASDCKSAYTSVAEFDLNVSCTSALITDAIGDVTPKTFTYSLQENPDIDFLDCSLESYRGAHVGRLLNASEDDPNSEYLSVSCTIIHDSQSVSELDNNSEFVTFNASKSFVMHHGKEVGVSTIYFEVNDNPPYPTFEYYYDNAHQNLDDNNTFSINARLEQPGRNQDNWTPAEWEAYMEEVMESAEMLRGTMPDMDRHFDTIISE
ncbi:MAG: hypothetical protein AAF528_02110 [Cyanobacteria bacterium P01_C01_bin.121]